MEVLYSYPLESTEINIVGFGKFGEVLDMKKFIKLVNLDCSFNFLTDIINLSQTLKKCLRYFCKEMCHQELSKIAQWSLASFHASPRFTCD